MCYDKISNVKGREMRMKYVVVDDGLNDLVIVFPEMMEHSRMQHLPGTILSAGFIAVVDGKWSCYGKSVSLGLESRPKEDSKLANSMLKLETSRWDD
jgi:hypothetical protein